MRPPLNPLGGSRICSWCGSLLSFPLMDPATIEMIASLLSAGGPTGLVSLFALFLFAKGWIAKAWADTGKRLDRAEEGLAAVQTAVESTSTALTGLADASKEQTATLGRLEVTLARTYRGQLYRPPIPNGRDTSGTPLRAIHDDHTPIP